MPAAYLDLATSSGSARGLPRSVSSPCSLGGGWPRDRVSPSAACHSTFRKIQKIHLKSTEQTKQTYYYRTSLFSSNWHPRLEWPLLYAAASCPPPSVSRRSVVARQAARGNGVYGVGWKAELINQSVGRSVGRRFPREERFINYRFGGPLNRLVAIQTEREKRPEHVRYQPRGSNSGCIFWTYLMSGSILTSLRSWILRIAVELCQEMHLGYSRRRVLELKR